MWVEGSQKGKAFLLKLYLVCVQDLRKRWDRQSRAFSNLFRQANRVEKLADFIQQLVGDLVLRKYTIISSGIL